LRGLEIGVDRRVFVKAGAAAGGAGLVWWWLQPDSYRWRLTLSVETPEGVRTASGVSKSISWPVRIPARGAMSKVEGEAIYLDLGAGRRPLIALVTCGLGPPDGRTPPEKTYWSGGAGPMDDYLLELYGETPDPREDMLVKMRRLARYGGARAIPPVALPDLVTFADVNDPASVMAVDRENLAATLGEGVKWKAITLEITRAWVTRGVIEQKLPWLKTLPCALGGNCIRPAVGPIATQLSVQDFIRN
jgi:hypothetical protein